MLKARGGLAGGRGLISSTRSRFIHVLPKTVPMCDSLESFCDVHSQTDQHTDLRETTITRDNVHQKIFRNFFISHSPFAYDGAKHDKLISIASGIVAPKYANVDRAIEIGEASASRLTGQNYSDVKMKRKERVIYISSLTNTTIVCAVQEWLGNDNVDPTECHGDGNERMGS